MNAAAADRIGSIPGYAGDACWAAEAVVRLSEKEAAQLGRPLGPSHKQARSQAHTGSRLKPDARASRSGSA